MKSSIVVLQKKFGTSAPSFNFQLGRDPTSAWTLRIAGGAVMLDTATAGAVRDAAVLKRDIDVLFIEKGSTKSPVLIIGATRAVDIPCSPIDDAIPSMY
jgi:hypothetical protein